MRAALASHATDHPAEVFKVGSLYCIHRRDNAALALVNARAADAFRIAGLNRGLIAPANDECRASATASTQNDPHQSAGLEEQFEQAGLLAPARVPPAHASRCAPIEPPTASSRIYAIGADRSVALHCDHADLAALLSACLEPLAAPSASKLHSTIHVHTGSDGFQVWREKSAIATGLDFATARRATLQSLLIALLPTGWGGAILHASTIAQDGKAWILAGTTGSGKSTLAMAMVAAGARYYADDLTPLNRAGTHIARFPLAASIKSGSWAQLRGRFAELASCRTFKVGARTVRYLDPGQQDADTLEPAQNIATPVGGIIFPKYDAASVQTQTEFVPPEHALAELLTSGSELVGRHASLEPLVRLVNTTPAWRLTFADSDDAVATIKALAEH